MSDQRRTELSNAGARRRDQMLPLLQDAIRDRVRRRRRHRAVACTVLALGVMIGLVEVFDVRSFNQNTPETLVATGATDPTPAAPSRTTPEQPTIDIQSFNPAEFYAQALERDPDLLITTPTELRADKLTTNASRTVAYVTTDQLMVELAIAGMDSAVICSADRCTLFTSAQSSGQFMRESESIDQEL